METFPSITFIAVADIFLLNEIMDVHRIKNKVTPNTVIVLLIMCDLDDYVPPTIPATLSGLKSAVGRDIQLRGSSLISSSST